MSKRVCKTLLRGFESLLSHMAYTKQCKKCGKTITIKNPQNEENIIKTHMIKCGKDN